MVFKIEKPFIFTLFGASGDLAKLKIFPSLYEMAVQKRMPKEYYIIGFARTKKETEKFREEFKESVQKNVQGFDEKILDQMLKNIFYFSGEYKEETDFINLNKFLKETVKTKKGLIHLAYFSVPPTVYLDIAKNLSTISKDWLNDTRLVIEKPFGSNLASAKKLFSSITEYFVEEKIFLLDHYLGKSSVQSIMHLRHTNRLLNLMMKGSEVANIQITAFEDIGINERVGYFENVGIIKDMIQSHLLQTLALITMSIPLTETAESIHRERYNILSTLHNNLSKNDIVIGQYQTYIKEKGVNKNSRTETFAALRLYVDRESWYDVPIYLRTGKKTCEKHTYVVVELKKFAFQSELEEPNRLIIEIQPEPRISITLMNKLGETKEYQQIITSDSIACDIDGCLPDHANLIVSALKNDRTFFLDFSQIIATWKITDAVIEGIAKNKIKIEKYQDGTCGPISQHQLTKQDGFTWFDLHL